MTQSEAYTRISEDLTRIVVAKGQDITIALATYRVKPTHPNVLRAT